MPKITEIIPDLDQLPEWLRDAFDEGQYFNMSIAAIKELESKLKKSEQNVEHWRQETGKINSNLTTLRAENAALVAKVEALKPYAQHAETCDVNYMYASGEKPCNCNLQSILEKE